MLRRLLFISRFILILGLVSCRASQPILNKHDTVASASEYIDKYKNIAISEMKRTGIPASITLAQGIIESDMGRSALAREANNHFGIKCHSNWTGPTIKHHDNKRNECFRKYSKPEDSFYDHSDFLKSESRYGFLFDIKQNDYKAWARGLKRAGYATNPDYANMVIRTIEENSLWDFDGGYNSSTTSPKKISSVKEPYSAPVSEAGEKPSSRVNMNRYVQARVPRVMEKNRIQYIIVKEGDTKEKLEKELSLLRWELAKYNELNSDFQLVPGQILYLQPKRNKAEPGSDFYNTVEGDSMYKIAQLYGIKLKSLYELNRMEEGTQPEAGKKIWLRSIKPVN
jgi:LysM repeat protein